MGVVAVDWSGRAVGAHQFVWLAEVRGGSLTRLENGRSREAVTSHLLDMAAADPDLVVGFDFSFSLPEWFLDRHGLADVDALWHAATFEGERWLSAREHPFWGRPGARRPRLRPDEPPLRVTEAALGRRGGRRPASPFQVGGAGSVGTGSVRGFPTLAVLRAAGFAVWPFDEARLPLVVEVWPRACSGTVVKGSRAARAAFLDRFGDALAPGLRARAEASEDAFDATVTAFAMAREASAFPGLPHPEPPAARREGWIWAPKTSADHLDAVPQLVTAAAARAPIPRREPCGGSPEPGSPPPR